MASLQPPQARLALMPYCEYANDFMIIAVPVQRDKAGSAARYHQFAQSQLRMPADKRMRGENLNGLDEPVPFLRKLDLLNYRSQHEGTH
jgi:hypothetical protein